MCRAPGGSRRAGALSCARLTPRSRAPARYVSRHANHSLKQFAEMQKVMKQMGSLAKGGRLPKIPGMRM